MTIIEFLTDRLDEDAIGLALMPEPTQVIDRSFDRQHLQADIAAKQRIIDWLARNHFARFSITHCGCGRCVILGELASVYADHPAFQADWKA